MNLPAKVDAGEVMESVIIKGDLSKLDPADRATYYMKLCESVGLNPLTRPLEYITLNGKLTLYAKRDCADQLRRLNGVSIEIVDQRLSEELFTVHVRAQDRAGRTDEDFGVVSLPTAMKGEARANLILKAITKAKRRVTLSISGMGFLDETEIADIPAAAKRPASITHQEQTTTLEFTEPGTVEEVDEYTGEVITKPASGIAGPAPVAPPSPPDAGAGTSFSLEAMAREAAQRGRETFDVFYTGRTAAEKAKLRAMKPELEALMPADNVTS